jgi:hypothetical protein
VHLQLTPVALEMAAEGRLVANCLCTCHRNGLHADV